MISALRTSLLALGISAVIAPSSSADGFGISYTKQSKHGALSLGYSTGAIAPVYPQPCAPPHCPPRYWVPAHYETVHRQVFVAGCPRTVWVDPVYEFRRDAWGRTYPVCVASGRYEVVHDGGRYETRPFQVWVAGHWSR